MREKNRYFEEYDYERITSLIKRCKWTWAKSYLDIPHEYIAKPRCPLTSEEFLYIVKAQRDDGINQRWGRYNFPYLHLDGYKYWTMGDTLDNTIIINRQKIFDEFKYLEYPYERYYSEQESLDIARMVIGYGLPVFEIGVGSGDFIRQTCISAEKYIGIDPNPVAIDKLKQEFLNYDLRLKPFEESRKIWQNYNGVVIALFGTASYLMTPYLKMLNDSNKNYFLMFFKPDKKPKSLENTHCVESNISEIFTKGRVNEYKDYLIVTSK